MNVPLWARFGSCESCRWALPMLDADGEAMPDTVACRANPPVLYAHGDEVQAHLSFTKTDSTCRLWEPKTGKRCISCGAAEVDADDVGVCRMTKTTIAQAWTCDAWFPRWSGDEEDDDE